MSDFGLVVIIVGAMLVGLAAAVVLEYRGFYQRAEGKLTISEYIYNYLGRSRKVTAVASFILGAAFVHFVSGMF